MASHRIIWRVTGALVACALLVLVLGVTSDAWLRRVEKSDAEMRRDQCVDEMIALLEHDPRARREDTRQAILNVTEFANDPALANAEVHFAMGLFYHSFGDSRFEAAEEAFRQAIALRPDWSWAYNRLAIVLFESGRPDEAEKAWNEAVRLTPDWPRPFNDRAIMYRRAKRYGDALDAVETAMRLDPESAEPYFNLAVILDTLGHTDLARTWYERSIDHDPDQAAPYFNIACGYGRRGELYPAVFYLRMAIERNPRFLFESFIDPDLKPLRHRKDFIRLLSMPYNQNA